MSTLYTQTIAILAHVDEKAEDAARSRHARRPGESILFGPTDAPRYVDGNGVLWRYAQMPVTAELRIALQAIQKSQRVSVSIVGELVHVRELNGRPTLWVAGSYAMVDTGERDTLLRGLRVVDEEEGR